MTIEEYVNSKEFQTYIKNNPVEPLYINTLDEVKPIDAEESRIYVDLAKKLKYAVKLIG